MANGLLQKARTGDTASSIFYLKTQAGWRETDRTEVRTDPKDITSYSDAELDAIIGNFLDEVAHSSRRIGVEVKDEG